MVEYLRVSLKNENNWHLFSTSSLEVCLCLFDAPMAQRFLIHPKFCDQINLSKTHHGPETFSSFSLPVVYDLIVIT